MSTRLPASDLAINDAILHNGAWKRIRAIERGKTGGLLAFVLRARAGEADSAVVSYPFDELVEVSDG